MATIVKGKNPNKPHTVRYYDASTSKQRERSFVYLKDARQFKAKVEHEIAEGTFIDPKASQRKLADVAWAWLERHPGAPKTKVIYTSTLKQHILPDFGTRPLADVANDREGVELWVRKTLPGKGVGNSVIRTCYMVLNAIVNDAVKAGRLGGSRIKGIKLPPAQHKAEIEFADQVQIDVMAEAMPKPYDGSIYLMRGCGLRLGEALGVKYPRDFRNANETLRLQCQLSPDGKGYVPLKHRGVDGYRDIPVPHYVDDAVQGYYPPPIRHRRYLDWFHKARDKAGLSPAFTPHMLRHIYASNLLAGGIPITDVSKYLGHNSIQVTYGIYGHLVPASGDRARNVLDEEWSS
jgi:integrase